MTVELARRLIESGVPLADIEAALLLVVARGLPLSEALSERDPGLLVVVDQELARSELPSVLTVRPTPELCARLPAGMCQRLLAVPVHVDPKSGRVDVAAVEPLDPHVAQEFAFHLQAPIRVLLAPRNSVRLALRGLQQGENLSMQAPEPVSDEGVVGSEVPIPLVKADPSFRSDAPIPLVRRSVLPPPGAVLPGLPTRAKASFRPTPMGLGKTEALSWRSKPPPNDLLLSDPGTTTGAVAEQQPLADAPPAEQPKAEAPASVRELLDSTQTPEQVVELLRDALRPALSIVFSVKNASFEARAVSAEIAARSPAGQISLLSHQPSVLETAVKSGFYLGPIPNTPNHRELYDALPPETASEVYATVITVSGRASLVWLIAGFQQSLDLTRRADELGLAAGRALSRIVLSRKRGS